MKMPFGKHQGKEIADIPKRYLKWLQQNADLYGRLAVEVDCVVKGLPVETSGDASGNSTGDDIDNLPSFDELVQQMKELNNK